MPANLCDRYENKTKKNWISNEMNANEKYSTKTYKLSWLYSEIRELDIIPWSEFFFGLSPLFQFDFITNFTMYRTVGCFCFKLSIQFNSIRSLFQFLILFFVGNTLLFSLLWIYNTFHLFFFLLFFFCQTVFFFVGSFGQNTNAMKTVTWLTEFFPSMYLLHNLFVFNSI